MRLPPLLRIFPFSPALGKLQEGHVLPQPELQHQTMLLY